MNRTLVIFGGKQRMWDCMSVSYAAHVRIYTIIPTEKIHHNQLIVEIRDKNRFNHPIPGHKSDWE